MRFTAPTSSATPDSGLSLQSATVQMCRGPPSRHTCGAFTLAAQGRLTSSRSSPAQRGLRYSFGDSGVRLLTRQCIGITATRALPHVRFRHFGWPRSSGFVSCFAGASGAVQVRRDARHKQRAAQDFQQASDLSSIVKDGPSALLDKVLADGDCQQHEAAGRARAALRIVLAQRSPLSSKRLAFLFDAFSARANARPAGVLFFVDAACWRARDCAFRTRI